MPPARPVAADAPRRASASAAERSLRLVVIAALCLPLLVFATAAWLSYRSHWREAEGRLARTLDMVREHAIKVFETADLVARQVDQSLGEASDEAIRAREPALHRAFAELAAGLPQISNIWVLGTDGRPLVASSGLPAPHDLDLSARAFFRVHRDGAWPAGRDYVGEWRPGEAAGAAFQVSVARRGPGFRGVIAMAVDPAYFQAFYEQVRAGGLDTVALLRGDGAILARAPDSEPAVRRVPAGSGFLTTLAAAEERGFYLTRSAVDGRDRFYAYRRLPDLPVYVTAGIDRASVLAEWRETLASHLVFGLPATAGLVALTLVALRRTRREGEALAQLRAEILRREASEEQLRQAQKMDAVGRLTGGLAHDFNNLLTIVLGSLELLQRRLTQGDARQHRLLDNAIGGAQRAAALTQRLLAFARRQPLDPKPLDANALVSGMAELLRQTLGEAVRLETVLAGGLWRTFADPNQLESALLNLAVNARDALPESGGRLTIETANAHLDEAYAAARAEVAAGQYVLVAVTDNGAGMTPEVAARAFEPFFTTKEPGRGTGLGLSQVYGFVRQSGGHVAVYSEPGQGTTVKLYLPRHAGPPEGAADAPPTDLAPAAGPATVLVVEDEAAVRAFTVEALRDLGYRVLDADGAATALNLLALHPEIDLLLTDVVMPDVNGRRLADAALLRRPDLPVLFMTGYTRNAIVHNGMLDPGTHLLTKPFTVAQLAAALRARLGGRGRA
ncbi:hybrid sensor histidine kinase/response regulator [Methylobacterium isbiliense]|uniref:hybrid sensor histidine kinase/response regulator n=1 Tax=Methylobacterium isbiliense TaxID=315478 RepID=UPI001EE15735|nr:hybrid sensor histidine kinase/response regulator [Methylobacterium isbiliense]MDN3626995.1 ATP-binding protein [Methylobacterium isbiliense]